MLVKKTWALFPLFILCLLLINIGINTLVLTKGVYISFYSERFTAEKLRQIIEMIENENRFLSYSILLTGYFIKIGLITICIFIGVFLKDIRTTLSGLFRTVVVAEFMLLLPSLIVLIWFGFIKSGYSLDEVHNFSPFSVITFFDTSELDGWMIFTLKTINLFHALYVVVLARELSRHINKSFWQGLVIVLVTYGLAFLLWLAFVIFLFINFS